MARTRDFHIVVIASEWRTADKFTEELADERAPTIRHQSRQDFISPRRPDRDKRETEGDNSWEDLRILGNPQERSDVV